MYVSTYQLPITVGTFSMAWTAFVMWYESQTSIYQNIAKLVSPSRIGFSREFNQSFSDFSFVV